MTSFPTSVEWAKGVELLRDMCKCDVLPFGMNCAWLKPAFADTTVFLQAILSVILPVLIWLPAFGPEAGAQTSLGTKDTSIALSPSSLLLASVRDTRRVDVHCSPPAQVPPRFFITLFIKRTLASSSNQSAQTTIVRDVLAGPAATGSAVITPDANIPDWDASIQGTIHNPASLPVKLTMRRADCSYAGIYICQTENYQADGSVKKNISTARLSVTVIPEAASIRAEPSLDAYTYRQSLMLICQGEVGTVKESDQVFWLWEYSDGSAKGSHSGNWTSAVSMGNAWEGPTSPGICNTEFRNGTYQRYLLPEDSGRQFRCYIKKGNISYTQYAAVYTVETVYDKGVSPEPKPPQGPNGPHGPPDPKDPQVKTSASDVCRLSTVAITVSVCVSLAVTAAADIAV